MRVMPSSVVKPDKVTSLVPGELVLARISGHTPLSDAHCKDKINMNINSRLSSYYSGQLIPIISSISINTNHLHDQIVSDSMQYIIRLKL